MIKKDYPDYRGRIHFFLPELLKNEFKAVCSRKGLEMSPVLQKFCNDYVKAFKMGQEWEMEKYLCKGAV